MGLYLKGREDDEGESVLDSENSKKPSVVHEVVNKRWEVCVTTSTKGFQQASFVNSIATFKVNCVFVIHEGYGMAEWFMDWSITCDTVTCSCINMVQALSHTAVGIISHCLEMLP